MYESKSSRKHDGVNTKVDGKPAPARPKQADDHRNWDDVKSGVIQQEEILRPHREMRVQRRRPATEGDARKVPPNETDMNRKRANQRDRQHARQGRDDYSGARDLH